MLSLVLLWALVLPVCFVFSPMIMVAGLVDEQPEASLPGFASRLSARAPPAIS
jgi:hypothetical protein